MTQLLVRSLACFLILSLCACGGAAGSSLQDRGAGPGGISTDAPVDSNGGGDGSGAGDGSGDGTGGGSGDATGDGDGTGGGDGAGAGAGAGAGEGDGDGGGGGTGGGDGTVGDGTGDGVGTGDGEGGDGGDGGDSTGGGDAVDPAPVGPSLNVVTAEERIFYEGAFLDDFTLTRDTVTLGGLAPFAALPTTGSASYGGYMQVIIGNASVSANVIGDTTLSVDLAGGPITGSASGFLGVTLDDALVSQVVNYEGVITVSGGGITEGPTGGSAISFDIGGALDSGLHTFVIEGTLNGYLFGAEASGLRATGSHGGLSNDIDATIDGTGPTPVGIATVWATKD